MNRTLILGGAGFIGANLIRALVLQGHAPYILELPQADLSRIEGFRNHACLYTGSLTETGLIKDILRRDGITTVVHLVSGLLPSSTEADFQGELVSVIEPTRRLFPLLREHGCRLVYFSSGGAIYGSGRKAPFIESDILNPVSYYGKSKWILEESIQEFASSGGMDHLIIRPSNPYGRFQSSQGAQGFIAVAVGKLLRGEPLTIWGDGSVVRDYLLVDDLMQGAMGLMGSKASQGAYNIGSGEGHSLLEVVRMIESLAGVRARLEFLPGRHCDPGATILNISKLQSLTSFAPLGLADGLRLYLDETRKHAF